MSVRRGFTLIEVLVGIAIGAALIGALGVFSLNLADTRARLVALNARVDGAEALFSTLDRALATALVEDASLGPGLAGSSSSLRIVRSAVGLGGPSEPLFAETCVVEVRFSPWARRIEIVREGRAIELPFDVRAMRIRYLEERGWSDTCDSGESGVFPVGVEVSVWFGDEGDEGSGGVGGNGGDDAPAAAPLADGIVSAESLPAVDRPADRRRFFRIAGAPRVDALALRSIRDEGGAR